MSNGPWSKVEKSDDFVVDLLLLKEVLFVATSRLLQKIPLLKVQQYQHQSRQKRLSRGHLLLKILFRKDSCFHSSSGFPCYLSGTYVC